ncbi:MAG: restriction endonuclease [Oscillatoriales cyanobacterium C42_A2020_001]|nr:restriction endonuclease [Leptolyngbyaceae cyanobacterium C42_A2020_001]
MAKTAKPPCSECGKGTLRKHPILGTYLCANCQRQHQNKYRYITKTRALGEYRLKPSDLEGLGVHEVDNPYYKKAAPMQLYLLNQIEELSKKKWGSPEPYTVEFVEFSNKLLAWFLEDTERLKQLPPDKFQYLIADRLENMGLSVQLVGDVYRKDGGVDIIAYPNGNYAFPFLLAVQAKHHHSSRKTGAPDVRDFHGVLTSQASPFHMGMIVTNTSFTADAQWFADNNQTLLRLRDMKDLSRWLKNDFVNESEWREIPEQVELAPGVTIKIPKRQLWLPDKSVNL